MSLLWTVYVLIEERGPSTRDDLKPHCGNATCKQIQAAIRNAASRDLIHLSGRRGRAGIYKAGPAPAKEEPPEPVYVRPVNSVFQLGGMA